eukprot:9251894-Pyramimonas_sp.AAC.1
MGPPPPGHAATSNAALDAGRATVSCPGGGPPFDATGSHDRAISAPGSMQPGPDSVAVDGQPSPMDTEDPPQFSPKQLPSAA